MYCNDSSNGEYNDFFDNLDRPFVEKWKAITDYYKCEINSKYYHIGCDKALVTIYDLVNNYQSPKNKITGLPPLIFILNGAERNIQLRRTDDTHEYYIYFGRKCEIEYILECGGSAVIDIGVDSVFIVNSEEYLPNYYEADSMAKHLYKCKCIPVADFVKLYMPNDYKPPSSSSFEQNNIILLKNKNYVPKKLDNETAVRNLYETYLSQYNSSNRDLVVNYVRQNAKDGTEFIDISTAIIPSNIICCARLYVVLNEIQEFMKN